MDYLQDAARYWQSECLPHLDQAKHSACAGSWHMYRDSLERDGRIVSLVTRYAPAWDELENVPAPKDEFAWLLSQMGVSVIDIKMCKGGVFFSARPYRLPECDWVVNLTKGGGDFTLLFNHPDGEDEPDIDEVLVRVLEVRKMHDLSSLYVRF